MLSTCATGYKYVRRDNRDGVTQRYSALFNGKRSRGFATAREAAVYVAKACASTVWRSAVPLGRRDDARPGRREYMIT